MATLLSYSAVFEQSGLASAAVARYRFNEDGGTDALDTIDDLGGTYQPGAAPGAAGSIGDGAASFDGTSGFVLVDTISDPTRNEPLLLANGAFEAWFTIDDLSQAQMLFAKDSAGRGTGGQVAAILNTSGRLTFALSDEVDVFTAQSANGVIEAGAATHMVANFGAGGMQLFVNGVEVATDAYTGGLDAGLGNFEQLVIGTGNGGSTSGTIDNLGPFVDGTIDEFAIYDRALADDEVQQLFDGGELGSLVAGTAENDELIGGSDDEVLRGAGGADLIIGGAGDDELVGGRGGDDLQGGDGDDILNGKLGGDILDGGAGDDLLTGNKGTDELSGGDGNDELLGNKGVDELRGGAGDDLLNGGRGEDSLSGGDGSDTFQIDQIQDGVDRILDFADGEDGDVLDLSAVIDFSASADAADFVQLTEVSGDTLVEVDADGGGDSYSAVFNLVGTTGLDVGTLVTNGNLQLEAPTS